MGTGVGEAMLISAATGAGTSALTGGDPLKGALIGAAGGGVASGLGGIMAGGAGAAGTAGTAAGTAGTASGVGAATDMTTQAANIVNNPNLFPPGGVFDGVTQAADAMQHTALASQNAAAAAPAAAPQMAFKDVFKSTPGGPEFGQRMGTYMQQNPGKTAMMGGAFANAAFNKPPGLDLPDDKYDGPLSRFKFDPDRYIPQSLNPEDFRYRPMAEGGLADSAVAQRMMAKGGHLGGYSDGGRLLKGPGDGMSDSIPAKIGSRQPARLADGEFVIPADVVSGLGNGSTDAGAKRLYEMMEKVRKARTGNPRQGKEINPRKYTPT
jgi:hypothetical protein